MWTRWMSRVLVGVVLTTVALYAGGRQNDARHDATEHAHAHSDMTLGAQEQCVRAYEAVEQLNRTLNSVRAVTDPVRLRAAVKNTEEPLAEARQHLGSCLDILKLMRSSDAPAGAIPPAAPTPF